MIKFFIMFCIKRIYHKILITWYCFKHGLILRGLLHDLDKFNPFHFIKTFLYYRGYKKFYINVINHKKRHKHHWEYWVYFENGIYNCFEMDKKSALEMVLDWKAALKGYFKKETLKEWYDKNKTKIILHVDTRKYIERMVGL